MAKEKNQRVLARYEGYEARMEGKPIEANPNPKDDYRWMGWRRGWMAADEHIKADTYEVPKEGG